MKREARALGARSIAIANECVTIKGDLDQLAGFRALVEPIEIWFPVVVGNPFPDGLPACFDGLEGVLDLIPREDPKPPALETAIRSARIFLWQVDRPFAPAMDASNPAPVCDCFAVTFSLFMDSMPFNAPRLVVLAVFAAFARAAGGAEPIGAEVTKIPDSLRGGRLGRFGARSIATAPGRSRALHHDPVLRRC